MSAPSRHIAHKLTRLALPHIPTHGFTASSLSIASSSLSSTPNSPPLDRRTIDALYPSPPANVPSPNAFSLKGLAIGNGGKRSLPRQELIALARGRGTVEGTGQAEREKTGPARALVKAWLEEGRMEMVKSVRESGLRGELALRRGLRARLEYNENVLDKLPEVSSASAISPRSLLKTRILVSLSFLRLFTGSRATICLDNYATFISDIHPSLPFAHTSSLPRRKYRTRFSESQWFASSGCEF